jgi:hypothetical protein
MKPYALLLAACIVAAILGYNLGLFRAKARCDRERTDVSVAASAAWGNLTRLWLSEIEKGQLETVQQQMLDHIRTERMSLAAYMEIPEVRERNKGILNTLNSLDHFVNAFETKEPQRASVP